ncbi:flagellar basal-body MS-ring/collar protein FliF [Jannaschia aquimarina]|uniref:Flagellar M-ring protein n=1 Tax=Jannaschia aquimarina TaxID=935700 RepID=A0A0D1EEG9_9RHOB|nr:flagellar basal-body MS-ring/collar protein FliF [Jannaschia aquimarina]KIT14285.1 Flagellar M-ring protein [Jannaschia aquimarina]SNS50015.1 flagellar M-ring protein FliF [Jannaschia aquimarina]
MQSLVEDFKRGNWTRIGILAGAGLGTFVLVLLMARLAMAPTMELLFARLDPSVAGQVVQELQSRSVPHEVRGDSIYVDGSQRDRLRLELAGEGLPGADGTGYELLDSLSGFGTTAQMFDAAYWRAREGELARTILAGKDVASARVHVATPGGSPFSRDRGATASVTLRMKNGGVPADFAEAIQSLVAGAVRGLSPDDVSVVDSRNGRVVSRNAESRGEAGRSERVAEMRAAIDRILTARVGPGRFVAEVSVDTTTEVEQLRERVLDPATRVVISTDTQESNSSESGIGGQGVTVASNLPDGDAGGEGGGQSQAAETRERVNYEVSERERQVTRGAGAVERITVAVMVDGTTTTNAAGDATWAPRSDEELAAITDLVQSAVGYLEERGDVVTVRSLPFEAGASPDGSLPGGAWLTGAQLVRLATVGGLLVALFALLVFVVKPLLAKTQTATPDQSLSDARSDGTALPPPTETGPVPEQASLPAPTETGQDKNRPALEDQRGSKPRELPDLSEDGAEDPVERLRRLIADRRDETVEVLKGWIEEDARREEPS